MMCALPNRVASIDQDGLGRFVPDPEYSRYCVAHVPVGLDNDEITNWGVTHPEVPPATAPTLSDCVHTRDCV